MIMWQFGGKDLPAAIGEVLATRSPALAPIAQALATLAVAEALHAIALEMRRTNDRAGEVGVTPRLPHRHRCLIGTHPHSWVCPHRHCSDEWIQSCLEHVEHS